MKNIESKLLELDLKELFSDGFIGIEKECLRVSNSKLSNKKHPSSLGSALTNDYITTDFSEAQLELITPPVIDSFSVLSFLGDLHHFTSCAIGDEILWPFSMPPFIDSDIEIPIADYGSSNLGSFKKVYRNGLSNRYGRMMQAISGIHFNFSFSDSVWDVISFKEGDIGKKGTRNEAYFNLLRNIYRMNWLIIYLFGCSPAIPKNYLNSQRDDFVNFDDITAYLPYATSLRMSEYGYRNVIRTNLNVSLNSIDGYISDLKDATKTYCEDYANIINNEKDVISQINSNILQIEDEYYGIARAKSSNNSSLRQISKLMLTGVDFIELRSLDLNPFNRIGIDFETLIFMKIFCIYCFLKESEPISNDEMEVINSNDLKVSKLGRKPGLVIRKKGEDVSLREWGNQIIDGMTTVAEFLDTEQKVFSKAVNTAKEKLDNPDLTPSAQLIERMLLENSNYIELGNSVGWENKNYFLNLNSSESKSWKILEKAAFDSLSEQRKIEQRDNVSFAIFLKDYFS